MPSNVPRSRPTNRFERYTRLTLFVLFLLTLAMVEFGLPVHAWFRLPSRGIRPNVETHHNYTPNSSFLTIATAGDVFPPSLNTINRLGIRGPDLGPKTIPRVLLVGDSFVQADEVRYEQTMQGRLGNMLGPDLEFIAHGIASWSPTPRIGVLVRPGSAGRLGLEESR